MSWCDLLATPPLTKPRYWSCRSLACVTISSGVSCWRMKNNTLTWRTSGIWRVHVVHLKSLHLFLFDWCLKGTCNGSSFNFTSLSYKIFLFLVFILSFFLELVGKNDKEDYMQYKVQSFGKKRELCILNRFLSGPLIILLTLLNNYDPDDWKSLRSIVLGFEKGQYVVTFVSMSLQNGFRPGVNQPNQELLHGYRVMRRATCLTHSSKITNCLYICIPIVNYQ